MNGKKILIIGLTTVMVSGSSMTAYAAGPGGNMGGIPGGNMSGGPDGNMGGPRMEQSIGNNEDGQDLQFGQQPPQMQGFDSESQDRPAPPDAGMQGQELQSGQQSRPPEFESDDEDRPTPSDMQTPGDNRPMQEESEMSGPGFSNGLEENPEGMPELPEGEMYEEGVKPFNIPEKPEDESGESESKGGSASEIDNGKSDKNDGFFARIGNGVKDGVQRIGNWFKNLFNKDKEDENDNGDTNDTDGHKTPGGKSDNDRPEMPGDMNNSDKPQMPGNGNDQDNTHGGPGGMPGGMGGESAPEEYDAANVVTDDAYNTAYSSTSDSENAVLVDGDTINLSGITVSKSGDSDGDSADFYGINAAILANNGATLTITDTSVMTDGSHANGIFSYGEGTTVNVSDTSITTTGNNSGGLMTTGGATLTADNVKISTSGNSSAAIRTDRGGGTVTASNSTGTTSGVGSPAIYSTADITVTGSTLTADNSEAVVIEGGNSVTLTDTDLTGNDTTLNGQSTVKTNVLIYQSMSGDASEGSSVFTMNGGSLTSLTGDMFHVTNVTTTINLTGVDLNYADDSDVLLSLSADSWGNSGSNGGHATVNLTNQEAAGSILVDEISSLTLNIGEGSTYTGCINASGASGTVSVTIEDNAIWTLTADTYVDSVSGNLEGINLNGHTLYVNGVAYKA